jgi:hypothetical protein
VLVLCRVGAGTGSHRSADDQISGEVALAGALAHGAATGTVNETDSHTGIAVSDTWAALE